MVRPRGEIDITCQNRECAWYLEEGKDIIKKGRNRAGHQQYYCFHCGKYFVETANTLLYHKHLPEKEITRICRLLVEKNGIRSIERITGHHRDTIGRLLEDLAVHAEKVNNYLIRNLGFGKFEMDEMWGTIKKNRRRLSPKALRGIERAMRGCTAA